MSKRNLYAKTINRIFYVAFFNICKTFHLLYDLKYIYVDVQCVPKLMVQTKSGDTNSYVTFEQTYLKKLHETNVTHYFKNFYILFWL